MSVLKIVLPESNGNPTTGAGTKVFDGNGNELTGITAIDISIRANEVVEAKFEAAVTVENMDALKAIVGQATLDDLVAVETDWRLNNEPTQDK